MTTPTSAATNWSGNAFALFRIDLHFRAIDLKVSATRRVSSWFFAYVNRKTCPGRGARPAGLFGRALSSVGRSARMAQKSSESAGLS